MPVISIQIDSAGDDPGNQAVLQSLIRAQPVVTIRIDGDFIHILTGLHVQSDG
jgi:hypothetical protein